MLRYMYLDAILTWSFLQWGETIELLLFRQVIEEAGKLSLFSHAAQVVAESVTGHLGIQHGSNDLPVGA